MKRRICTALLLTLTAWTGSAGSLPPPLSAPASATDSISPSHWTLLVRAHVGTIKDSLAEFGTRTDATPGYDPQYEIPRPPVPPGTSIQVHFPHDGGNWPAMMGSRFAIDYTSPLAPAWRMMVETNAGALPVTLRWDTAGIAQLPQSYYLLMKDSSADSLTYLKATDSYTFSYTGPRVFLITAEFASSFIETAAGWNILSVPRTVADNSAASLFPDGISPAYGFDSSYHSRDTLQPGEGYWMKFAAPAFTVITGLGIDSLEIPVRQGWNMVGSLSRAIPAPTGPEITSWFYQYAGGYGRADSLSPGRGYWVKVSADGILSLTSTGLAGAAAYGGTGESPTGAAWIRFRSSPGPGATLHLLPSDDAGAVGFYDLPPPPPGPGFDVRFAGGGGAALLPSPESAGGSTYAVELRTEAATVFVDGDRGRSPIDLYIETGPDQWRVITGTSEPVALTCGPGRTIFRIRAGATVTSPAGFRLEGNYPNPFNPSTRIRYRLPEETLVSIIVSDPAGRMVVRGEPFMQEAGVHQYEIDAARLDLSGGVYFYQVTGVGVQSGNRYAGSGKCVFLK